MDAIVRTASASCLKVAEQTLPNRAGLTRSTSADASVARKHDVPDALSQFHSKTAAYGVGCATTGGTR